MNKSNFDYNTPTVYTSLNTYLAVNNEPLGFVQEIEIEDIVIDDEKFTDIILHRLVNDREEIINTMRFNTFSFKILNSPLGFMGEDKNEKIRGYYSSEANVIGFKMHLSAKAENNPTDLLKQKITIRARSFMYYNDLKNVGAFGEINLPDDTDFKNLVNILKKNQEAKTEVPSVVLPKDVAKMPKALYEQMLYDRAQEGAQQILEEEDARILEELGAITVSKSKKKEKKKKNSK